ncbi:MAG TPA: hypothetical protein VHZ95_18860 [Polyangiales bacterium]|nr:hypothetical protein [Polyangiales bacterium]
MNELRDIAALDTSENENSERQIEFAPLLSSPLRAALRGDLSPQRSDRARVRRNIERALLVPATASVLRVDLSMTQRMAASTRRLPFRLSALGLRGLGLALTIGAAIGGVLVYLARSVEPAPTATTTTARSFVPMTAPLSAPANVPPSPMPKVDPPAIATVASMPAHNRNARRHQRQTVAERETTSAPMPQPIASAPTVDDERIRDRSSAELAEELRLLGRASRQLAADAPTAALAQLREHDRRYPRSALAKESRALRVVALCEMGAENASSERDAFLRDEASSPMAARVRNACEDR